MESTPYYVLFVALAPVKSDDPVYYYPIYGDSKLLRVKVTEDEHRSALYLTQIRQLSVGMLSIEQTEEV